MTRIAGGALMLLLYTIVVLMPVVGGVYVLGLTISDPLSLLRLPLCLAVIYTPLACVLFGNVSTNQTGMG